VYGLLLKKKNVSLLLIILNVFLTEILFKNFAAFISHL